MSDVLPEILQAAQTMASANVEAEPEITEILIAPASDRVLLVEVDPTTFPAEGQFATPIYFRPAPEAGIPFPSGVVVVTPEERDARIALPSGWGPWEKLIRIWPNEGWHA